jgi:hypothetical protein
MHHGVGKGNVVTEHEVNRFGRTHHDVGEGADGKQEVADQGIGC